MTAAALLADLKKRGVVLNVGRERLRWQAPKGAMTAEFLTALRQNKAEVLALLASRSKHKFLPVAAPRPLTEIYVTLPGDGWLADGFYYMRRRAGRRS